MANSFVIGIGVSGSDLQTSKLLQGIDITGGVDSIIQSPSLTWTYTLDTALDSRIADVSSLVGKDITIANAANAGHNGTNTITAVDTGSKLFVKVIIAGSGALDDEFSPSPATYFIPDVVITNETAKLA